MHNRFVDVVFVELRIVASKNAKCVETSMKKTGRLTSQKTRSPRTAEIRKEQANRTLRLKAMTITCLETMTKMIKAHLPSQAFII